jgi:protein-disulfide isomerase
MTNQDDSRRTGLTTPIAILIGSVIIAASIVGVNLYNARTQRAEAEFGGLAPIDEEHIVMTPVTAADHVYGNARPKVQLVEYADTECPFCRRVHPLIKKIVDQSNGDVAWVFRHFPLDDLHPRARSEAEAAECAADLGGNEKFWEYLQSLFASVPGPDSATASSERAHATRLQDIAAQIGLDKTSFAYCVSSGKHRNKIEAQYQDGVRIGITGTPTTVLVNAKGEKKVVLGAAPEQAIRAAINKLK